MDDQIRAFHHLASQYFEYLLLGYYANNINKGERDKINLFENPGLAFSSPLYCTHLLLGALHSCINSKITIKGDTDEIDNFENLGLALFFYSILHIITPEPN